MDIHQEQQQYTESSFSQYSNDGVGFLPQKSPPTKTNLRRFVGTAAVGLLDLGTKNNQKNNDDSVILCLLILIFNIAKFRIFMTIFMIIVFLIHAIIVVVSQYFMLKLELLFYVH